MATLDRVNPLIPAGLVGLSLYFWHPDDLEHLVVGTRRLAFPAIVLHIFADAVELVSTALLSIAQRLAIEGIRG